MHPYLEIAIGIVAVVSPIVTGWLVSRAHHLRTEMERDFAEFKLELNRDLNGRYVWRKEGEETWRRLENLERRLE